MTALSRSLQIAGVIVAASVVLLAQVLHAQERQAPESREDVLQGIAVVDEPTRAFLPKYRHELFAVAGYTGTFTSAKHQWPTLVLGAEWLPLRPGRFDFGIYADFNLGRSDERHYGRVSSAFGLEVMWRVVEDSVWDLAPLIRGAYVLNWEHTDRVLLRPGVGAQVSLLRFVALQATFDVMFSPSDKFSIGTHQLYGFSLALKLGIAPLVERWPQYPAKPKPTVDRSRVVCEAAAAVCVAAGHASARDTLCAAALSALDISKYSAGWGDPTTAYLAAVKQEAGELPRDVDEKLRELVGNHQSSVKGLEAYAEMQRTLDDDHMLNKRYSYLVTPVMIRDWLGCDANGAAARTPNGQTLLTCPSQNVCKLDTGVATH